ncbi:hypothetical protein GCM10010517_30590 [Streptosporangium fragile]|uniref:Uncharacterized protein n=1 Tax=Streptosporangium fragile TaxID=46186 RepID=A0ABP6ICS2_9ACTN
MSDVSRTVLADIAPDGEELDEARLLGISGAGVEPYGTSIGGVCKVDGVIWTF